MNQINNLDVIDEELDSRENFYMKSDVHTASRARNRITYK